MIDRSHPVARHRVLVTGVLVIGLFLGIVTITNLLRHPGLGPPSGIEEGGDPRTAFMCPDARPREGDPGSPTAGAARPPAGLVSSNELYDCPASYDGRLVRYRGEVVGAVLRRDDGAWLQLNDDVYAGEIGPLPAHRDFRGGNAGVGVFVPHDVADAITFVGGPDARGDILEVVGTFRRVDDDSEVTVIRTRSGQVWREGGLLEDPPLRDRRVVALVTAGLALAAVALQRWRSRHL